MPRPSSRLRAKTREALQRAIKDAEDEASDLDPDHPLPMLIAAADAYLEATVDPRSLPPLVREIRRAKEG